MVRTFYGQAQQRQASFNSTVPPQSSNVGEGKDGEMGGESAAAIY